MLDQHEQACAEDVAQGFTSYPLYTLHGKLPFAAWHASWLRPSGTRAGVTLTLPQLYVAPDAGGRAVPGALAHLYTRHVADRHQCLLRGWVPPTCEWGCYLQAHSTPERDQQDVAKNFPTVAFWASPTRIDAEGEASILALCDARRKAAQGG